MTTLPVRFCQTGQAALRWLPPLPPCQTWQKTRIFNRLIVEAHSGNYFVRRSVLDHVRSCCGPRQIQTGTLISPLQQEESTTDGKEQKLLNLSS